VIPLRLLDRIRAVKSPREISRLRKGAEILEKTLRDVLGIIREGISERNLARYVERRMKKHGAEALAFPTIAALGENSSEIHHVPSDRKLKRNEIVMLDFGAAVGGYCSDMTRTLFFGKPPKKFATWYARVLEAQRQAIAKIRDGEKAGAADAAARNYLARFSRRKSFPHGTGHGVGLVIHEWPYLRKNSSDVFRSGMVVTVEPGIYLKRWGGIRIEDMVLVKKTRCEVLMSAPKELKSIIISP